MIDLLENMLRAGKEAAPMALVVGIGVTYLVTNLDKILTRHHQNQTNPQLQFDFMNYAYQKKPKYKI